MTTHFSNYKNLSIMLYISHSDQQRINKKIARLPAFMKGKTASIIVFQGISTLLLTYGVCISIFHHPIKDKIKDPSSDLYISCFFYFALSVAAPFTGGHMNPAVTITLNQIIKNKNMIAYFVGQFIGAFAAAILAHLFFDVTPALYVVDADLTSCLIDCLGQIFGTFIFIFFILYVTQGNYASGQYFGYLIVSLMLLMGRTFTFRKGCLNPIIGFAFQVLIAYRKSNPFLIVYSLPIVVGPILGGILAWFVFSKFYKPLLQQIQQNKLANAND